MQNKINVHKFDTLLKYNQQNTFTKEQKEEIFKKFKSDILDLNVNQNCIYGLELIISGLNNNTNYDDKNNCDASDILADILTHDYIDLISLICEQLSDMYLLGKCPQGRTTRLLQIWNMF